MQSRINNTQESMQYTGQYTDRRRMRRWQSARRQAASQPAHHAGGARVTITINLDLAPAAPAGQSWRAQKRTRRSDAQSGETLRGEYRMRRGHGRRDGARGLEARGEGRWSEQPRGERGYGRSEEERRFAGPRHPRFGEQPRRARGYSRWTDRRAIRRWRGGRTRLDSPSYY